MITTLLNADATAVIPAEVLEGLGVRPGNRIGFEIRDREASIFRHPPDDKVNEAFGMTHGELRAMIAETETGPTDPADEATARLQAHADEIARGMDAA